MRRAGPILGVVVSAPISSGSSGLLAWRGPAAATCIGKLAHDGPGQRRRDGIGWTGEFGCPDRWRAL